MEPSNSSEKSNKQYVLLLVSIKKRKFKKKTQIKPNKLKTTDLKFQSTASIQ